MSNADQTQIFYFILFYFLYSFCFFPPLISLFLFLSSHRVCVRRRTDVYECTCDQNGQGGGGGRYSRVNCPLTKLG
uniref:Uncharacterized protein n=1 Tax=Anguilla anguilla TaxID=7936 RepID=A0A0E9RB78_ANGAN